MDKRMRASSPEVQAAARRLRCEPTRAEVVLWEGLRKHQVRGVRFRRQHAVGQFVLDFYATSLKLAIEVDGDVHDSQAEQDQVRTDYLAARGIRVIRFRNEEVLNDTGKVLAAIRAAIGTEPDAP
ncbi:MAG TPA: endonuclease domain-containing protein [Longimicrobium sp.]|jgi:very-short-patch-repair endonuclease